MMKKQLSVLFSFFFLLVLSTSAEGTWIRTNAKPAPSLKYPTVKATIDTFMTALCLGDSTRLPIPDLTGRMDIAYWPQKERENIKYQFTDPLYIPENIGDHRIMFTSMKASPLNLITNGDFEAGDSGFGTDYAQPTKTGSQTLYDSGTYTITTNPTLVYDLSVCNGTDHTTEHSGMGGNMMAVNGSENSNEVVWSETGIEVKPNTEYIFEAWVMNLRPEELNRPQLQFQINNKNLASMSSPSNCQWTQIHTFWNSEDATSIDISLINLQTAVNGNDFALDDILFSEMLPDTVIYDVRVRDCDLHESVTSCLGQPTQLNEDDPDGEYYTNVQWSGAAVYLDDVNSWSPTIMPPSEGAYSLTFTANFFNIVITKTYDITVNKCTDFEYKAVCVGEQLILNEADQATYTGIQWEPAELVDDIHAVSPVYAPTEADTVMFIMQANQMALPVNKTFMVMAIECIEGSTQTKVVCGGGTTETLTATQGTAYQWNTGATTRTINVSPKGSTQYICTVEGSPILTFDPDFHRTKTIIDTFNVDVANVTILNANPTICFEETDTLEAGINSAVSAQVQWTVSNDGVIFGDPTDYVTTVTGNRVGDCTITLTATFETDPALVCQSSIEMEILKSPLIWDVQVDKRTAIVTLDPSRGVPPFTYTVEGKTYDTNVLDYLRGGDHLLTVTGGNGCTTQTTFTTDFIDIIPPTIFTPNDNGVNDRLVFEGIEFYEDTEIMIFDRFGKQLITYTGKEQGWDGTYLGQKCPSTDYWYLLVINDRDIKEQIVGHFTLMRR